MGRIRELIRTNNLKVSSLRSSADDRLARFGVKERNLAIMVHGEHKKLFSKEPRGPIGSLVTVIDPQWNRAVECCLGPLLNSYVCDNFKDADILRRLASKNGIAPESFLPYRLDLATKKYTICQVNGSSQGMTSTQCKSLRSFSGGERSFATICLLLSLWEITDLPFRCLDEFDVFMDMVNRDTAINMLIDYAGQPKNLHRQFIFFSPLQIRYTGEETTNMLKIFASVIPCVLTL
ncbi:Structural maintenance of chromosomes protein 6 [Trichuris trichiura]|uniref:Structural maintenance of chromosomes protein 6 n=1 Tax=Trichuris trichiura TaxID=36087 RepID=A0A077Z7A2_TRITR|nr:Structural maintenance of chromosomes protein 6 [Trichuris trichiura]